MDWALPAATRSMRFADQACSLGRSGNDQEREGASASKCAGTFKVALFSAALHEGAESFG
jgi:hypothetical protein